MAHRFFLVCIFSLKISGMSDRLVNAVTGVCLMSHGGLMIMYRGVSPHSILPIINFSIILPLCSIIITFLFILIGRHWHVNFIESLPKSFIGILFYSSSIYYCKSVKILEIHLAHQPEYLSKCAFLTLKRFCPDMSTSDNLKYYITGTRDTFTHLQQVLKKGWKWAILINRSRSK